MAVAPSTASERAPLASVESVRSDQSVPEFSELYRQYLDFVWSAARRQGVGRDAIDDLVQEVFVVIHSRLPSLEQPESLRSWIYGIVRRTVSTYRRARRVREGHADVELAEDREIRIPTPLDLVEHQEDVKLLSLLLTSLDPPKREVFVLAELEELTAPEIAAVLEIPVNTAYSRLRAARQEFEQALIRHNARRGGRACPS